MNRYKGFSLAEILLSLWLSAITLVVVIGVLMGGLEAITKGRAYTEAVTLAQSRMEKIICRVSADYYSIDDPNCSLRQPEQIGDYNLTVTLSPYNIYDSSCKRVTVEVKNSDNLTRRKGADAILETVFINKQK